MSAGGGSSSKAPKLTQVSIPGAEDLALNADITGYGLSDTAYATGFTAPLVSGRSAMITDANKQSAGGISSQATGAVVRAGLGDVAKSIPGKNDFQTARNLGQPILSKEQRDRNFASNLLLQNPQRVYGLGGQDVTNIALANTGNVNAINAAVGQTQANAYSSSVAQGANNFAGITSLLGGLSTNYARYGNIFGGSNIYTNPEATYALGATPPPSLYGQSDASFAAGAGYVAPGG